MSKRANRLSDLEIDEISTVDVDANGYAKISFSKTGEGSAIQEGSMPDAQTFYDDDGDPVDIDDLDEGDVVRDQDGAEFVYVLDAEDAEDLEPVGVGKALATRADIGRGRSRREGVAKSTGDRLLEDLSKALTDGDRDQVIAKALSQVSALEASNHEIAKALEDEQDLRLTGEFVSKAAQYNLPIAPQVFGPILKSLHTGAPLSDDELDALDDVFKSVGAYLFEEIGSLGDTSNASVMDEVDKIASQVVRKTGGQLSDEQAFAAALDANPAAYDEYLKEMTAR